MRTACGIRYLVRLPLHPKTGPLSLRPIHLQQKGYQQHHPRGGNRDTENEETHATAVEGDGSRAMSRVIVAGDAHLGAHNANVEAFNDFLEDIYQDRSVIEEVILLGDLWDMVRRDPFGVAWETATTLERLKRLANAIPVQFIFGNHDLYLQELDDTRYELEFRTEYTLEQDGTRILFRHGNEFDGLHSNLLSKYLSGKGDRGDIDPTRGRKDPVVAGVRDAVDRFKSQLRTDGGSARARTYPRRERRAHEFLRTAAADKLVYGHTHSPYVHHDNLAANPGSWKSTTPVHNTYVEITEGQLALYQYRVDGEDERLE